jgi:hypothetical protein
MGNLLSSYEVIDYTPSMVLEAANTNGGKMILRGIIQKADTLNQNGRIYPKDILDREIRNYQKYIMENRALGELDHPSDCVPTGSEIFTLDGWKKIEDINNSEIIATLNINTNEIEYQRITEKVDQPYTGDMIRFSNARTMDMMVTPNHRILAWDRKHKPYFIFASEAYKLWQQNDSPFSHSSLHRTGVWRGEDPDQIEIAGKLIDAELWAAFLGIYIAEGYASGIMSGVEKTQPRQRFICVTQKKLDSRELIKNMMSQLPWQIIEEPQGFTIVDDALYSHLFELGSSHYKHIPNYAKSWSPRLLQILLEWMLLGDGRNRYGYKPGSIIPEYATTSKKLVDDVYEVMLKLGSGATIHTYQPKDRPAPDYNETGRMILSENSMPMNIIYQHSTAGISLNCRFMKAEIVPYSGRIYCVRVPNNTWLMRYNGKVCWTGNSVINLKNVSHIMREAKVEGNIVYGALEVLETPSGKILESLIKSGVKLGISSRGVGSTSKQGEYYVVEDDFVLITFDMVSEPSTTSAFMLPEGKQVSYDRTRIELPRADRINRIIGDIKSLRK